MKPLYSIFDQIAGFYSPVFIAENDGHATRMMAQSIDMRHRTDFSLWKLGEFDADKGEIHSSDPLLVVHGKSLPLDGEQNQ